MAGITDSAFRLLNIWGGVDLVYSEMAHVNALSFGGKKTLEMLAVSPFESSYVVQLFGNDPKFFGKAAKLLGEKGVPPVQYQPFTKKQMNFLDNLNKKLVPDNRQPFAVFYSNFLDFQEKLKRTKQSSQSSPAALRQFPDGIDINLGCPAKKVFGHGSGAKLFEDVPKIRAIVEEVLANTNLPVSLKMRSAVGDVSLLAVLEKLKDLPIKRVMVHGRSYEQGFSGEINYQIIKEVKEKYPQFSFWANGGINDWKSAEKVSKKTGCLNLGIARGALGNPLLAGEIKQKTNLPVSSHQLTVNVKSVLAYIHTILNQQAKGEKGMLEIRKHLAWYFTGFPEASKLRTRLVRIKTLEELEKILREINSV